MAQAICLILACLLAAPMVALGESRLQFRSVVRADARTGRLVRTSVVRRTPALAPALTPAQRLSKPAPQESSAVTNVGVIVEQTAALHGVEPALVQSVISVESGFNPLAVSPKGAQGLMQLIPATARRFGVTNSFDARQNIEAGVKYLRYLQDMFKDDKLALAAYNAGEGAVMKYGGVPPYRETERYVQKVGLKLGAARLATATQVIESKAGSSQPNELTAEQAGPRSEPVRTLALVTDEAGRIHFVTGDSPIRKTLGTP
jgi:soluble lytic murein transglycosylase-like protein